jgi:purine nucleoside phosphorylase
MTLFDRAVSHTDFSDCFPARKYLLESAKQNDLNVVDGGCYVGLSGPRYESSSEIKMIEQFGGDVVGMTASTEAILFREAKVPYACLAVVTNFGCGMEASELNHEEVVDVMKQKGGVAKNILLGAVELV